MPFLLTPIFTMRTKSPSAHDLIKLAAKIPAWITIPAAAASYFGFGILRNVHPATKATSAAQVGDALTADIIMILVIAGQYILPYILLAAAAVWLYQRYQVSKLQKLADTVADQGFTQLDHEQFEDVCAAGFATHGFVVQRTAKGADGGIDLIMTREGHKFVVQCKHYSKSSVGVDVVRSFLGAMAHYGADAGYFVTSGSFTRDAASFAAGKDIWLYNGDKLMDLLSRGRDAASAEGRLILDRAARSADGTPDCPLCRARMTLKVARQGPRTGKRFFGCTTYPACSGTVDVDA